MKKKQYEFLKPIKPETFSYTPESGYFNAAAARLLIPQGEWISFEVDSDNQAFLAVPQHQGGILTYKMYQVPGSPVRVRGKLKEQGLKYGVYIHIGENVFQHVNHM